jgi:hypothetical protein
VLDGLTFCGLVVGQAVTIKRGVADGVGGEDGVAVGKRVTKYMGVDVVEPDAVSVTLAVRDTVGVGVSDTDAVSCPTAKLTPHASGV